MSKRKEKGTRSARTYDSKKGAQTDDYAVSGALRKRRSRRHVGERVTDCMRLDFFEGWLSS